MSFLIKLKSRLQTLNSSTFVSLSFSLLVLSIPLQYRYHKMFKSWAQGILKQDLELTCFFEKMIFFCSSDVFILCLFIGLLCLRKIEWKTLFWEGPAKYLSAFFLVALVSIVFSHTNDFLLQYIRWFQFFWIGCLFFLLAQGGLAKDKKELIRKVFCLLVVTAVFQCSVAIVQYFSQHYLGLRKLGEINISSPEVSPAIFYMSDGSLWIFDRLFSMVGEKNTVIRAYGTLPHPNILGGFLVLSLFSSYYLYIVLQKRWQIQLLIAAVFFQIFALFITYSRSALFGWVLGSLLWFALNFWKRRNERKQGMGLQPDRTKSLALLLFICVGVCFALFYPQIIERGGVINYTNLNEVADKERAMFNTIASNIVESHPLTGIGFNSYLLKMKEFSTTPLAYFQLHQVHNIFLLVAAETGVIGLVFFCLFLFTLAFKMLKKGLLIEVITLSSIFIAFLFIGCCDFYFLDGHQGKLMLFLLAGLMGLMGRREAEERIAIKESMILRDNLEGIK